jgi:hypothetical protein
MKEPRNPFTMRASEHIESDDTFLRLFGPGVLDILQKEEIWNRIQIFRSAPGGGKTSLFRLFAPQSLMTLYDFRANDDCKELYHRLKDFEVISEEGPRMLAVFVSCVRNYAALEDINFDRGQKDRLFYSLLNSRIILATLRAALALKKLTYPNDLPKLQILRPTSDFSTEVPIPCSGKELHDWAAGLERKVCNAIDSFASPAPDSFLGSDTLFSLSLLRTSCIQCQEGSIASRTLLMLDDVHKLAPVQRKSLLISLFDLKLPVGVWIAERLEALSLQELLGLGGTPGREYNEPIVLEEFWRPEGNSKRFEQTVGNIADRRARLNPDVQVGAFDGCLQSSLDSSEWQGKYTEIASAISTRLRGKIHSTKKYENWIKSCEDADGTAREKAIRWRAMEIRIERDIRKSQKQLVDSPLPEEALDLKIESTIKVAAELFLSKEFQLPYYYGFPTLAKLSSSNIEQFLQLASDLFEEFISSRLLQRRTVTSLSPDRQENILKRIAEQRWEELPRSVPNGREVVRLLESIGQLAIWETEKPNSPYAPGVTGIAISMTDRARLIDPNLQRTRSDFTQLAKILSTCISNNLLEASLDRSQGQRGKTWMILYLNRLLCLHFKLPLQYGGWRPVSLNELCKYVEQGVRLSRKKGGA